jgi:diguanylate cyclase (GGDEF)-like protein/PAS domain S-box-containing protein
VVTIATQVDTRKQPRRDWRVWAIVAFVMISALVALAFPGDVTMPLMMVPLLVLAMFASTRIVAVVAVAAALSSVAVASKLHFSWNAGDTLWLNGMFVIGVLAMALAHWREREQETMHALVAALSASESHYRLLAENSSDVVLLERDGCIEWISPSLTATLGWTPEAWVGHSIEEHIHADDLQVVAARRSVVATGVSDVIRLRMQARDQSFHWVEVHAGRVAGETGEQPGIVASFRLIDAEVEAEQRLERQASFDDLTGAFKRESGFTRLQDAVRRTHDSGNDIAVLFLDVDDFKDVNDNCGHATGDVVLKAIAQRTRASIRSSDSVTRLGGDEFLVLLEGIHTVEQAFAVAEKIRCRCCETIDTADGAVSASVSIGVTLAHAPEPADDIVARADRAMYQAKAQGRNRVIAIAEAV